MICSILAGVPGVARVNKVRKLCNLIPSRHFIISICEIPSPLTPFSPPPLCPLPCLFLPLDPPPHLPFPVAPSPSPPPHLPLPTPTPSLLPVHPPLDHYNHLHLHLREKIPAPQSRHATTVIEFLLIYSFKMTFGANGT